MSLKAVAKALSKKYSSKISFAAVTEADFEAATADSVPYATRRILLQGRWELGKRGGGESIKKGGCSFVLL